MNIDTGLMVEYIEQASKAFLLFIKNEKSIIKHIINSMV